MKRLRIVVTTLLFVMMAGEQRSTGPLATASEKGPLVLSSEAFQEKARLLIRQHQEDKAIQIIQERIKEVPGDLPAYVLLGDLYYEKDQLQEAIRTWEKILEREPSNLGVLTRLEKARREIKTHSGFSREMTRHFTIKFDGEENRHLYRTVLGILEEAYGEIGRAFSFYPVEEVIVFLYTHQQFLDITHVPAWSGGAFDGKIRIPTKGYEDQIDRLREVLFHEYVHAVIHRITEQKGKGQTAAVSVPVWLHEGIAQYLAPTAGKDDLNRRLKRWMKQGVFIELPQLHGSWLGLNNVLAAVAYDESLSAVSFLVDRFGIWRMKRVLEALSEKGNIDAAMQEALMISYEAFQIRWKETL